MDRARNDRLVELEAENERLRRVKRTAEILIHSLLGDSDDETTQAGKLLAWSEAAAATRD